MSKKSSSERSFISINFRTEQLDALIKKVIRSMSNKTRREASEAGANAMLIDIAAFYTKAERDNWINPTLPTHGTGRKPTRWWEGTARGWSIKSVSAYRAVFSNSTRGLAHKITGGTIAPTKRKYLAIPLVPEAHGKRPKEFANRKRMPLHKAGNALVGWDKKAKKNVAIYALVGSVTHKPWRNALPPDTVGQSYANAYLNHILAKIMD